MVGSIDECPARDCGPVLREAVQSGTPLVMRGLVSDWPVVAAAHRGDAALLDYFAAIAGPEAIDAVAAPADAGGRFHYDAEMRGFTFARMRLSLGAFLGELRQELEQDAPRALAAQGVVCAAACPGFDHANPLPVRPGAGETRLWIGTAAQVAAHSDPADNIAYVAGGRRRFTLFAPEAVGDLYMGPFDPTPAGTPIAMTDPLAPDFDRYPRFATALDAAQAAELEPGDAVYIPLGWYHHVAALDRVNVLINYWWRPQSEQGPSPWDAMLHGMMALRGLPPAEQRVWRAMFDHFVFETSGPAGAHLPPHARGVLDARSLQDREAMRAALLRNLSQRR